MEDYICLLVGHSGTGKSTVADYLEKHYNLPVLQSYTTRPKRFSEEKGHMFISEEEFNQLEGVVAHTMFNGYEYCATAEQVNDSSIYIVDVKGIEDFKNLYRGNKTPIIIHLAASVDVCIKRMRARGDSIEKIMSRVNHDKEAFAGVTYDIKIDTDNKTVQEVAGEIYNLLEKEGEI